MDNMIFVFGSNLAGIHGAGAAKYARENHGAEYGIGEGPTGSSYALPTKDHNLEVRSLEDIEKSIDSFLNYVYHHPYTNTGRELTFLVTPIGTGLAGYTKKQIASLFKGKKISKNIVFSKEWFE